MEKVRIQDDLYNAVNGEWIENAIIPDDKPTTGGFANLAKGVEQLLIDDFKKMKKENSYPDKYLTEAGKLFNIAFNTKKEIKKELSLL